jgi:hypothetical protein
MGPRPTSPRKTCRRISREAKQHGLAEHVRDRPQRLPELRLLRDNIAHVLKTSLSTDTEGWKQDAGLAVLAADARADAVTAACRLSETFGEASVDVARFPNSRSSTRSSLVKPSRAP